MVYPTLTHKWAFPTEHEREIFSTIVYEIFYDRILLLSIISVLLSFALTSIFFENKIVFAFILSSVTLIGILLLLMPIFIKPWDMVLSNKRLILRHRYWFSGRFTTVKAMFVEHLESEKVTPRIKIWSLLLGFFILQTFSIVLIDFGFTASLPFPIYLSLLLLFGGILGITSQFQSDIEVIVKLFFSPFFEVALILGFATLLLALGLIIFSLPHRKIMTLMTIGGHRIQLNAGIPEELSNLVFAVGRSHNVLTKVETKFKWDIPLLEDEKILSYGRVGLINRRTQIVGILSLLLVMQSLDSFYNIFVNPGISTLIIFLIQIINLTAILLMIAFSKRYHRIIATNHRLLFQEERINVSGLWGKRIYEYSDLQKKHLQGFIVSRFTGITFTSLLGLILLIGMALLLFIISQSILLLYICIFIIVLYLLFNYKAFTKLEFQALSGFQHRLEYSLPLIIDRIAHQIENYDWLYDLMFANILTSENIIKLCNDIRSVNDPIRKIAHEEISDIHEEHFFSVSEPRLHTWNKIGPAPFIRTGIITGSFLALVGIYLVFPHLNSSFQIPFILLAVLMTFIVGLRRYILFTYTLVITSSRIFLVRQKIPRKIAKLFGVLPEWSLHEAPREHILSTSFRYIVPPGNLLKFLFNSGLFSIIIIVLQNQASLEAYLTNEIINIVLFFVYLILIFFIPLWISQLIGIIPRYSLLLYTRFNNLQIPYFKDLSTFSNVFGEQLEIFVENDQIIRI